MLKNNKLLLLIFIAVLFMSLGYASINSLSRDINGEIIANAQDGIFITDVLYESGVDVQDYKINKIHQTVLHSNVNLSDSNGKSQITFKIQVYNSYDSTYYFNKVKFIDDNSLIGENTYSNQDILFMLSGLHHGDAIEAGESKEFYITFYYSNNVVSDETSLNSYLNFEFTKRYLVTNMIENGSFESTVNLDNIVQDSSMFINGLSSGKLVATSNTFDYLGYYNFYKDHVYYFSGYFNIVNLTGSNAPYVFFESYIWLDANWGASQWHLDKYNNYSITNGWERWTFRSVEIQNGTNIPVMLGVFDSSFAALRVEAYFDEFLLIDLTDIFGAGNEPSEEWCRENIEYVEDSEYIYVNY